MESAKRPRELQAEEIMEDGNDDNDDKEKTDSTTAAPKEQGAIMKDATKQSSPKDETKHKDDRIVLASENTSKGEQGEAGNDQVTVEPPPKQPLVATTSTTEGGAVLATNNNHTSTTSRGQAQQTNEATAEEQERTQQLPTTTATSTVATAATTTTSTTTTSAAASGQPSVKHSTHTQQQQLQHYHQPQQSLVEQYAPYIRPTDTSLEHARQRLRAALQQTHALRASFTHQVYKKYRVCLIPPTPPNLQNPNLAQLQHDMAILQKEKHYEKKQTAQLNTAVDWLQRMQRAMAAQQPPPPPPPNLTPAALAAAHMWTTGQVDQAEQLSFVSAGLNLIILPEEQVAPELLAPYYHDRAPIHPVTGQRVRSISQAAATSGDIMLERKRKALALRLERQQQPTSSLTAMEASALATALLTTSANAATAALSAPSTTTTAAGAAAAPLTAAASRLPATSIASTAPRSKGGRPATSKANASTMSAVAVAGGKGGRSRAPAGLSTATLLNLHPSAEEVIRSTTTTTTASDTTLSTATSSSSSHKPSAATLALYANSARIVGSSVSPLQSGQPHYLSAQQQYQQQQQQRLIHPHPESLGGRRRANDSSITEPAFSTSQLALTLPPLPANKERLERKPLPVAAPCRDSERVTRAVQTILRPFVHDQEDDENNDSRDLTGIELLYKLEHEAKRNETTCARENPPTESASQILPQNKELDGTIQPSLDPIFTLSVLQAVGLIGHSSADQKKTKKVFPLPSVNEKNAALWSPKLLSLHKSICSRSTSVTGLAFADSSSTKRRREQSVDSAEEAIGNNREAKRRKVDSAEQECTAAGEAANATPTEGVAVSTCPVVNIRGGGKGLSESSGGNNASNERMGTQADLKKEAAKPSSPPRKNSDSSEKTKSSKRNSSAQSSASTNPQTPNVNPEAPATKMKAANGPLHGYPVAAGIPNQIYPFHHPAAGDLANYLGSFQAAGYDLSRFVPGAQASAMNAIGALGLPASGIAGYTLEERINAARALQLREQQAAAMLGGTNFRQSTSGYSAHVNNAHPGAAYINSQAMNPFNCGPLSDNAKRPAAPRWASNAQGKKTGSSQLGQKWETLPATGSEKKNMDPPMSEKGNQPINAVPRVSLPSFGDSAGPVSVASPGAKKRALSDPGILTGTPARLHKEVLHEGETGKASAAEQPKQPSHEAGLKRSEMKLGMKVFVPDAPDNISPREAELIRTGHFYQAASGVGDHKKFKALVEYLLDAGGAVPIPKALVLAPVKEKLSTPAFRNLGGVVPISREVVTAAILVWLWQYHEANFQKAFDRSGRIDVDPDCKWLIQAAVDVSVRELCLNMTESLARGHGALGELSAARKSQAPTSEHDKESSAKKVECRTGSVVSQALMIKLQIDPYVNNAIPKFESLVAYLDESRLGALRAKSQERVLLANLLARKATMSESFSHAYVSAMVRAGEALGHGRLFEGAQNEDVKASTMIPYDIFTDDSGAWEDPCQHDECFPPGLTGDALMRRAHARAMIQKSLRKLQDRNNIRGGATNYGPYSDFTDASRGSQRGVDSGASTSRPGLKRRYSSISEPPPPPGTGSGRATSWAVYDPRHVSEPLEWHSQHLENKPYGRHRRARVRSLSLSVSSRSGEPRSIKKAKRSMSLSSPTAETVAQSPVAEGKLPMSTHEISWADVAGIFHTVEAPRRSTSRSAKYRRSQSHHSEVEVTSGPIFAPFCRKVEDELPSEGESDSEEEVLDETAVLANHQVVLDEMKKKISAFLEARKKQQERRKNRYSK